MATRQLIGGDWTFGKGVDNYLTGNAEIAQNVSTRIKSFKYDWFLDGEAHIDWFGILGQQNNEQEILDEVRRVTLSTEGVAKITNLEVLSITDRKADIELTITTVLNDTVDIIIGVGR